MLGFLRRKSAPSSNVLAQLLGFNSASWSNRDYQGFAEEGYLKNIVAYHCIRQISQAVADVPYFIEVTEKTLESGPLVELLQCPNPTQCYQAFLASITMPLLIDGNSYILGNIISKQGKGELISLRPDRVEIKTSSAGQPTHYEYKINNETFAYPIDPQTHHSDILHIKEPHPTDDLYGLSPMEAAGISIDQHNESSTWNKKLLENSARFPGILTMKDPGIGTPRMTQTQLSDISNKLNTQYTGFQNAGKIPVFNFDMAFQSLGMTPTDMDWLNAKNSTARDICLAFGYPPHLLGMAEGATFNNVGEAKLSFYEETVIPLTKRIHSALSHFLSQQTGQNIQIVAYLDQVSALAPRREIARKNAREDLQAGVITINEAREEMGYDPLPGLDNMVSCASSSSAVMQDEQSSNRSQQTTTDESSSPSKEADADSTKTKSAKMDPQSLQDFLTHEGFSHKMAKRLACQAFTT